MKTPSKILRTEGVTLRPQHFQQQDRYHDARLHRRTAALHPYAWGLTAEAAWDEEALANNTLRAESLSLVFPDGETYDAPGVVDGNATLDPNGPFADVAKRYVAAHEALQPVLGNLCTAGAFSEGVAMHFNDLMLDDLVTCCRQIVAAEPRLRAWCAWRKVRRDALSLSLTPLVDAMETGAVRPSEMLSTFETIARRPHVTVACFANRCCEGWVGRSCGSGRPTGGLTGQGRLRKCMPSWRCCSRLVGSCGAR